MNESFITSIVEARRVEAIAAPSIPRWRSLAMMAKQIADAIEENDPDNIMVVTHRAIYQEAHGQMIALQPVREADDYQREQIETAQCEQQESAIY